VNLLKKKITLDKTTSFEEEYYIASQWQLMWRKFKKHKLALGSIAVLIILYLGGIFCEFVAPMVLRHVKLNIFMLHLNVFIFSMRKDFIFIPLFMALNAGLIWKPCKRFIVKIK